MIFYFPYRQGIALQKIEDICDNSKQVYLVSEPEEYNDNESGVIKERFMGYVFSIQSSTRVVCECYGLAYICGSEAALVYEDCYEDADAGGSYYFKTDYWGNIVLTTDDGGGLRDLKVKTNDDNKIIAMHSKHISLSLDDYMVEDLKDYSEHKLQYEKIDTIESEFLSRGYYGTSVTWKEVLDHTFTYYEIYVEPSDTYKNGYRLTISGEYSINPINLPDVTREGILTYDFDNDLSAANLVEGEEVKNACDVYVSLGTNWYLDNFYGY